MCGAPKSNTGNPRRRTHNHRVSSDTSSIAATTKFKHWNLPDTPAGPSPSSPATPSTRPTGPEIRYRTAQHLPHAATSTHPPGPNITVLSPDAATEPCRPPPAIITSPTALRPPHRAPRDLLRQLRVLVGGVTETALSTASFLRNIQIPLGVYGGDAWWRHGQPGPPEETA